VLGGVRLDGVLGAGGMGRVYEGFDLSLHRTVAVKVLDRAAPAEVKERFAREGRSLASLEHPNVVSVHAAGVSPEGTAFIVMKLLAAKTLNDWSGAVPLPANTLLPVLRQVASAIDALHSQGIIHRDIKPANVMVDEAGKVTLVDLGVALANGPRLTQVGFVVGTVDFMSPEQMAGEPVSPATDLYALGLLTSELLVGPRRRSLRDREHELASRLSGRMPRIDVLNPSIAPEVALVVQRALAPAASDRFQTAGAFLAAFERALAEPSVRTLDQPALQRPRSRSRMLLVLSSLAAIGVGGWSVWSLSQSSDSRAIAVPEVQPEVVAHPDAASLRAQGSQRPVVDEAVGSPGTLVDNNAVVDDVTIGEFRREERDGQSIERMLARMNEAIKSDDDKKELFERALRRVNDLCSEADTKRKLIDCDDEARKLHERFFKL
jgi:serine/threonine-protein kinase